MSEYAGMKQPKRLEDLDNRGTLFESFEEAELDKKLDYLVDTRQISYTEAREHLGVPVNDLPRDNEGSVSISMPDRYEDELRLLDITSGNSMRNGFERSQDRPEIVERYGANLPDVVRGAHRNILNGNQMIRAAYHAEELKRAGFSELDINDDVNMMRMQYRREYAGPENANKRAARRRFLRKKLAELSTNHAA